MNDLLELISSRKSVRKYLNKEIPDEDLRKILEAGRLAPSWMNVQCWKFILIKSQENKDLLSELSIGQQQVKNAAALIVCLADTKSWDEAGITGIQNPALNPAMQCENGIFVRSLEQVIFPVSYMMLEAEALGISSCIIGAVGSDVTKILPDVQEKAKIALNISDGQIIASIIALGYEENPKQTVKTRKDFDSVIYLEKIGQKF